MNPRLLRIITRLNTGGPVQHVTSLHESFRASGWLCHLIYGKLDEAEGDSSSLLRDRGNSVYLPWLVRPVSAGRDLLAFLFVFVWLIRHPVDIVHTHTAKAGLIGRLAAFVYRWICLAGGRRAPLVFHTYHGHVFSGYFSKGMERMVKGVERLLLRGTTQPIALTEGLAAEISAHLGVESSRFAIIPLGLRLETFGGVERKDVYNRRFGRNFSTWVGWAGRLAPIKNPLRFLEIAAAMISSGAQDCGFVLVGDGPLKKDLTEAIVARGLEDKVFLAGWAASMPEAYSGMDLFFNTSDNEGTPVAVIEALAAGLAIAAADVGGTAECVPEGAVAWCFPPGEWHGRVDAWVDYIRQPRRQTQTLREFMIRSFSTERLREDLEKLYLAHLEKQTGEG
ncbi:MAG: glycosyltransferase [Planctomycetes bacterium]|nr:glycosyltransferase [Planctomycetota bacterium]